MWCYVHEEENSHWGSRILLEFSLHREGSGWAVWAAGRVMQGWNGATEYGIWDLLPSKNQSRGAVWSPWWESEAGALGQPREKQWGLCPEDFKTIPAASENSKVTWIFLVAWWTRYRIWISWGFPCFILCHREIGRTPACWHPFSLLWPCTGPLWCGALQQGPIVQYVQNCFDAFARI
jgi:hypothetical protein